LNENNENIVFKVLDGLTPLKVVVKEALMGFTTIEAPRLLTFLS
jgi:hypothetical protein